MCRMLIALGNFRTDWLIDDFILMAADRNEKHENNANEQFLHGDGWGIVYEQSGEFRLSRAITPCYEDVRFNHYRSIQSSFFMMHARKGSKGIVNIRNVHPFREKDYIFCHNGAVNDELSLDDRFVPSGETDSERFFYYLLSQMPDGRIQDQLIRPVYAKMTDYTGMNTMITDGLSTYVVNWYSKNPDYYNMKLFMNDEALIVSSEVLPHFKGNWQKLVNRDILKINNSSRTIEKL